MSSFPRRDLRLIRLGVADEMRNPAFRLFCGLGALAGAAYGWGNASIPGTAALVFSQWAGPGFALAACLWFATGALRDQNASLGAVLRSKPIDGGRWVFLNWATGTAIWLLVMSLTFAGAAAGALPGGGLQALVAYGLALLRAVVTVVPLGTVGFALTRISRSPLGGSVVALAMFCVVAGLQYAPSFLRPDYFQNTALFIAAAAGLLALSGPLVERFRRGELRRPLVPIAATLGCVVLTAGAGTRAYRTAAPPSEGSVLDVISRQYIQPGRRAPGFWLPDGRGGTVRTADYTGKILLIYIFPIDDLEAAQTLPALRWVQQQYGSRGVQPLAVALTADHGAGAQLVLGSGYPFPIGWDPSTVKSTSPPDSAVSAAYNISNLPLLIVTDRRRQVREMLTQPSYAQESLRTLVEARLALEPK